MKVSGAVAMADDPEHAFGAVYPTEAQMEYVRASKNDSERMDRSLEVAALARAGHAEASGIEGLNHLEGVTVGVKFAANTLSDAEVERVAKAIYDAEDASNADSFQEMCKELARAAIKAYLAP